MGDTDFPMEQTIYWVCAVAGCTLIALQVILQRVGLHGADSDTV